VGGKKERMERRGVRSESMARPTVSPEDFADNVPSETDIVIVVVAVIVISKIRGDQQIVCLTFSHLRIYEIEADAVIWNCR